MKQPGRGGIGLQSDPCHLRRFASDQLYQRRRFSCGFAFEDDGSLAVDDAYADLLQRHIQRDILLHGGIS
jgi:hypothetical protein